MSAADIQRTAVKCAWVDKTGRRCENLVSTSWDEPPVGYCKNHAKYSTDRVNRQICRKLKIYYLEKHGIEVQPYCVQGGIKCKLPAWVTRAAPLEK